jgi:hypothetical protein
MKGKLWKEAQDALKKISDYAVVNQTAKIEVMFLNNLNRIEAIKVNELHYLSFFQQTEYLKGGRSILTIFNTVSVQRPSFSVENLQKLKSFLLLGGTPTGERLQQILNQQIDALDAAVGTSAYSSIYPLDVIVITDGRPSKQAFLPLHCSNSTLILTLHSASRRPCCCYERSSPTHAPFEAPS